MSLDHCDRCADPIDTDVDLDCYVEAWPNAKARHEARAWNCLCPGCRGRLKNEPMDEYAT